MAAAINARIRHLRGGIGTAAATAARDGEKQLIDDESRVQSRAGGRPHRRDFDAGEIRHGDRKGRGVERAAAHGGGAVKDRVLLLRGADRAGADAGNPQRLPDRETGDIAQGENERFVIIGDEIVSIVDLDRTAAGDADAVVVIRHRQCRRRDARGRDREIKVDARGQAGDIWIRRTQSCDRAGDTIRAETHNRLPVQKTGGKQESGEAGGEEFHAFVLTATPNKLAKIALLHQTETPPRTSGCVSVIVGFMGEG